MRWNANRFYQLLFGERERRKREALEHAAFLRADAEEADAVAARLARLWFPKGGKDVKWREFARGKRYFLPISDHVEFEMIDSGFNRPHVSYALLHKQAEVILGEIRCNEHGAFSESLQSLAPEYPMDFSRFASHWMPFLRRGCWLSGVPIDASAHEKAEWIQGFSREELQAWNLKM